MSSTPHLSPEVAALLGLVYRHNDERVAAVRRDGLLFAHYTSAENALLILSGRSLWLRNAAVMNDHSEIAHGCAILDVLVESDLCKRMWAVLDDAHDGVSNDIRQRYYHEAHYAREMTFMTSLCEHDRIDHLGRLSMWRAYGGPVAGVALVFNSDIVTEAGFDLGVYSSPVLYGGVAELESEVRQVVKAIEANVHVFAAVDRATVADVLSSALRFALLSTKHPGFNEEREWRLLCMLDQLPVGAPVGQIVRSVGGIPQRICELKFPEPSHAAGAAFRWDRLLDRIIIGPSVFPDTIKDAIERELKRQGVGRWDKLVEISDIPLRR